MTSTKTNNHEALQHKLRIIERQFGSKLQYEYEFTSIPLRLLRSYKSKLIDSYCHEYVEKVYRDIENRWLSSQDDIDFFIDELRAFGGQLLDQIVPEGLQRVLWDNRNLIDNIILISDEPSYIPWELIHLKPPGIKKLPNEICFLGQMGLVRWLSPESSGYLPLDYLKVRRQRAYGIFPSYPSPYQLPQIQKECDFLTDKFQITLVEPRQNPVRDLIKKGEFDLLHFAGHGIADLDKASSSMLMLQGCLQSNDSYKKEFFRAVLVQQFFEKQEKKNLPIVVLNACQVGKSIQTFMGMGGFAKAFVEGGVGAFIAPLWSIRDKSARKFVESLYDELSQGRNLSTATNLARNFAQKEGDGTWLAYAVYGHPYLKVDFGNKAEPEINYAIVQLELLIKDNLDIGEYDKRDGLEILDELKKGLGFFKDKVPKYKVDIAHQVHKIRRWEFSIQQEISVEAFENISKHVYFIVNFLTDFF